MGTNEHLDREWSNQCYSGIIVVQRFNSYFFQPLKCTLYFFSISTVIQFTCCTKLYSFTLFWTILHFTCGNKLYGNTFFCTLLHFTWCTKLHFIIMLCTVPHFMRCTKLPCINIVCKVLHFTYCTKLHCSQLDQVFILISRVKLDKRARPCTFSDHKFLSFLTIDRTKNL